MAVNGTIDGHEAEVAYVARQGARVAWLEVATLESGSSPWAVRVVDDVLDPEVRTLMESSNDPVPVGYRIELSGAYLHMQRIAGEGKIEQVRVRLETGHAETVAGESSAFAAMSNGVEWAAGNLLDGLQLAARPDSDDSRMRDDLPPSADYPAEVVTEMAASDAVLVWEVASELHVLDRETQTVTLVELRAEASVIDTDGHTVVWGSALGNERTGYFLLDGQMYRLGNDVTEAAVAGEWLTWTAIDPDGSARWQYLARIAEDAGR